MTLTPQLLKKLKDRQPEILESLFRETTPMLVRVLATNGIYRETAEDLVHQTWERFLTNVDKFEGRSDPETFICGILINKIREFRRLAGRHVLVEDPENVMAKAFATAGWWNVEHSDPATIVYSKQVLRLIEDGLHGLTEQQKSAFILKEVELEETREICNVLGVNSSHLRVLIFRAKHQLRQHLDGKLGA